MNTTNVQSAGIRRGKPARATAQAKQAFAAGSMSADLALISLALLRWAGAL